MKTIIMLTLVGYVLPIVICAFYVYRTSKRSYINKELLSKTYYICCVPFVNIIFSIMCIGKDLLDLIEEVCQSDQK